MPKRCFYPTFVLTKNHYGLLEKKRRLLYAMVVLSRWVPSSGNLTRVAPEAAEGWNSFGFGYKDGGSN